LFFKESKITIGGDVSMCNPGPDFTCEHLPRHFVKTAKTFVLIYEKGKHRMFEGKILWATLSIRLCGDCSKDFIKEAELTEEDKNVYGVYTPGTTDCYK
jgi:hypothetical protein